MKYRAIAIGLRVSERPVQTYGGDIEVVREWSRNIADQHGVDVTILVTEEVVLEMVGPKEEEKNVRS